MQKSHHIQNLYHTTCMDHHLHINWISPENVEKSMLACLNELHHPSLSVAPHPSIYFLTCCSLTLCARWRINSWSRQEHPATQCRLLMAEQCGDELWWLSISAVGSDLMEAGGVAHQQLWITMRHHFTVNRPPYVGPKALLKQGCRDLHWQNLSHLFKSLSTHFYQQSFFFIFRFLALKNRSARDMIYY